jgi:DNA-directed RNA polymerase omega subunit
VDTDNNGKKKELLQVAARKHEMFYFDELLPDEHASVFLLARVAMTRALEIHFGKRPLVDFELTDKETTIALREIVQGKITFGKNGAKKVIKEEPAAEPVKGDLE